MGVDHYDRHIGYVGQFAAVDIDAAARALAALIGDAALRRRLGESGRRRARETYDWQHVVAAYQGLWRELAEERARAGEAAREPRPWAARPDPFALFAGYPSRALGPATRIARGALGAADVAAWRGLGVVAFAEAVLPPADYAERLLARVPAAGETTLEALAAALPEAGPGQAARTVAWLAKLGALRLVG
jgi:hypothetical protein